MTPEIETFLRGLMINPRGEKLETSPSKKAAASDIRALLGWKREVTR
jgi:hypothetical protein